MNGKNRFFVFIIVACTALLGNAQNLVSDSLNNLVKNYQTIDKYKVQLLIKAADAYKNTNIVKSFEFVDQAKKITELLKDKEGEADVNYLLANLLIIEASYDEAMDCTKKSLVCYDSLNNKKGQANCLKTIGVIHYYRGDVMQSIDYHEQALALNMELKDSLAMSNIYAHIGTDYFEIGDFTMGFSYAQTALDIAYAINNDDAISTACNNLGVIYEGQGNFSKALDYYQKSFVIDEKQKNYNGASIAAANIALIYLRQEEFGKAIALSEKGLYYASLNKFIAGLAYNYEDLGMIYKAQGNFDKAIESLDALLVIQNDVGNKKGVAIVYNNKADILSMQGFYAEALSLYEKSLAISTIIAHKQVEVNSYIGIAKLYSEQKIFKKANQYSKKAYDMALKMGNVSLVKQSAEILARSYEKLGLYKAAYLTHVAFKTVSDSLFDKESVKKIAQLEYEYKYDKEKQLMDIKQQRKDRIQVAELNKQKLVRNILLGSFCILMVFAVVILRLLMQKQLVNKILQHKNKEIEQQAKELKDSNEELVQLSQFKEDMTHMVVHDLKNPLATMLNINIIKNEARRMDIMMHSAYKMMNLVQNILDVYKYESTQLYLNIQKVALFDLILNAIEEVEFLAKQKHIDFDIDMQRSITIYADANVIRRVLVNILSNAVKFSVKEKPIAIQCSVLNHDELKVSIHNFGSYILPEQKAHIFEKFGQAEKRAQGNIESTGLGLTYCKLAIDAHKGALGVDSSETKGTSFWFILPNAQSFEPIQGELKSGIKIQSKLLLSDAEKCNLMPHFAMLQELSVFEMASFKHVFETIEREKLGNKKWLDAINRAVLMGNEKEYEILVKMIYES